MALIINILQTGQGLTERAEAVGGSGAGMALSCDITLCVTPLRLPPLFQLPSYQVTFDNAIGSWTNPHSYHIDAAPKH